MNKTDRLLAIVLKLQSSGKAVRAADLASFFETSKRTIYRDIQALSEAGVPIHSTPGQGYGLVEGYFLPPLSFSTEEAIMLLLGGQYIAQNFDDHYQAAAKAAMLKIEGVLPPKIRAEVGQLQDGLYLIPRTVGDQTMLKDLRRAMLENRTVRFKYSGRTRNNNETAEEREADPYGLVNHEGNWYLRAYCHLRHDIRRFRLERMESLSVLSKTFTRPANYKLVQPPETRRDVTVRVLFNPIISRWVKESRYFYITEQHETEAGLLVTLQVRHERDPLGWILSWGQHAQVLEPDSLRQLVQTEAAALLQNYSK